MGNERLHVVWLIANSAGMTTVPRRFYLCVCVLRFVCLLLPVVCLHGQNREVLAEFKIGVVGRDLANPHYQAAHAGVRAAARVLSEQYSIDLEIVVQTPKLAEGESQATALAELLVANADGVVISPEADAGVRAAIEFAVEAGQQVVLVDSLTGIDGVLATVGADEREVGRQAARAILPKLPSEGRVAVLVDAAMGDVQQARLEGAREVLGFRRIERIVQVQADYVSAVATLEQVMEADRNRMIKGWLLLTDAPLQGAPVLPWAPGRLPCVAVQTAPSSFLFMDQGYLTALVAHPCYDWGYRSVELLVDALYREQMPESASIVLPTEVIDSRNVDDYRRRWVQWLQ